MSVAPPTATPPQTAQRFAESGPPPAFADPARRTKLATAFAAIDARVAGERTQQSIAGVAVGVVVDGELVHTAFAGARDLTTNAPVDGDTVFRIGSITKTFTAEALLVLRDEGKLSLDDAAMRYLPELAGVAYPTRDAEPMTLRQMLMHVSGLPRLGAFDYTRPDRDVPEAEVLEPLAHLTLLRAPGLTYEYSNYAFGLLGLLVGRVAGQSYRDVVVTRLTRPLGMTSASWSMADVPTEHRAVGYVKADGAMKPVPLWRLGASEGLGGLSLSLRDLAKWAAFQLDAWPARDGEERGPLRRSSRREAQTFASMRGLQVSARNDAAKGEPSVDARASGQGLPWYGEQSCEHARIVRHNGAVDGFVASVAMLPEHGVAIVALANSSSTHVDIERVTNFALEQLRKTGGLEPRRPVPAPTPAMNAAVATLVRVQNEWDEEAYLGMLTEAHKRVVTTAAEKMELEEYARRHGPCTAAKPLEVTGTRGRYALSCARGRFEMTVVVDERGKIAGFSGESFDLDAPPDVARAAERVTSLIERWDDAVYNRYFAPELGIAKKSLLPFFQGVARDHGRCGPARRDAYLGEDGHRFVVTCERGGDVELTVSIAKKSRDHVTGVKIVPRAAGVCPVR